MSGSKRGAVRRGCAALIVAVTVAITGCVESVDDAGNTRSFEGSASPASSAANTDAALDVSDHRNVLPDGLYRVTVGAASCDVNDAYRGRVLLFRSRAGERPTINIPLPWRNVDEDGADGGILRQDLSLSHRQPMQLLGPSRSTCAGEADFDFVEIDELTPTRLRLSFQRMALSCPVDESLCTVTATFELVQRSCDPSCEPQQIVRVVTSSGMDARCTCAP